MSGTQKTLFKQVADDAISTTQTNLSSTGVTQLVLNTGSGALFPTPGNGFWITLWNGALYPTNPTLDPNMEKALCTGRVGDVLTITATQKTHTSPCTVALLHVSQNITDIQNAINNLELLRFDVRSFGAVCDGATDDTAAINAALTAAGNAGGGVVIQSGWSVAHPDVGVLLNLPNVWYLGLGNKTGLTIPNGFNTTGDLVRVTATNCIVGNMKLDGNKANQTSGTNYGLFVSGTVGSGAYNLTTQNWTGVGTHFYNNNRAFGSNLWSTNNTYHGFEFEQNSNCTFDGIRGYSNTLHGVLVDPGEVGGTGSHGNTFTNVECDGNSQYGLAFNAANGDISAWLSEGDVFNAVSLTNNSQYGLNIYKQDKQVFNGLYIKGNGYFGIYLFESQNNTFNGLFLHNNSQASAGSYDEILVEGYNSNNAHPSKGNIFNGGQIIIDGTTKARWAYNEATVNDGGNFFVNINVPNAGTSGKVNAICPTTLLSQPAGVLQVPDNGQAIQGAMAGLDAAFSHVMRVYNNFTNGVTQAVNPNGHYEFWMGGNHVADVNQNNLTVLAGFITPVVTTTSAYTMLATDRNVLVDATRSAVAITLPTAVGVLGQEYVVKDWKGQAATHNITIATSNSQTIDGASTKVINSNYGTVRLVSDGANWSVV